MKKAIFILGTLVVFFGVGYLVYAKYFIQTYESPSFSSIKLSLSNIAVEEPMGEAKELEFQGVQFNDEWQLDDNSFDLSVLYRGILYEEKGLEEIWRHMINAYQRLGLNAK